MSSRCRDLIECPFHGWQFRGEDGKCTLIPYAAKVPDPVRVTWPSREAKGMLLLWYHCQGLALRAGHCTQEVPKNMANPAHLALLHGPAILGGSDLRYTRWSSPSHYLPSVVFPTFEHPFLGHGILLQMVTCLDPLLQRVHKIYYQKIVLVIILRFFLRAECRQMFSRSLQQGFLEVVEDPPGGL
ncbi:LOW QUALITY PROTEIN: cholesterol 7-desaturase nvd-like [Aegotheles albertisi]